MSVPVHNKSPQANIAINGDNIKRIRESKNLTQLYIATALGVTVDTVSRWENRRSPNMKMENAVKLAEILDITIEEITEPAILEEEKESETEPQTAQSDSSDLSINKKLLRFAPVIPAFFLLIAGFIYFSGSLLPQGKIEAVRYLPHHAAPGQPFPVVIRVQSSLTKPASFIMKEFLPPSCIVSKGEPAFVTQLGEPMTIKWLNTIDEEDEIYFAYLAGTDMNIKEGETLAFSGRIMLDVNQDQPLEITGSSSLEIVQSHWADTNKDQVIDDTEILTIYNSFDVLKDLGIDIKEISRIWAGKGYRWDKEKEKFVVIP